MTLPNGGEIAAGQINNEFGRSYSSEMSIWHARNGYYGTINDASGPPGLGPLASFIVP